MRSDFLTLSALPAASWERVQAVDGEEFMTASPIYVCCVHLARCHEVTLLFVAGLLGLGRGLRLLLRQHIHLFSNS
jgi:hypothetical protein